jgi:acetylornithine deacetylase/succinyl-diaminopimelate desuccinylase-like protein
VGPEALARDTGEATELLQHLIRNACVNDGTKESGGESRNAELLRSYLEGSGLELEGFEAQPGRENLVARLEGRDRSAPSLLLMGHTDVVPANPARWRHDPFGGELIDGEVWGRGAVDMLNLTASMAVAIRRLAAERFVPAGTLVFLAVADEEALGTYGAGWLLKNQEDAVRADFVVTEAGGFRLPLPSTTEGAKMPVLVAEKGSYWCTLRVRGTPGHASMPLRTDNALVKAAEVVGRIAEYRPETRVHDVWRRFVEGLDLPPELARTLLEPESIRQFAETAEDLGLAREVHACTHTTFAPTVMRAGVKTNVIPDTVELQVDIRTLPGQTGDDVRAMLREALGDELFHEIEVVDATDERSTESPMDTPLWESLQRVTASLVPGARIVPSITTGATDARFFRRRGITAYGAGLFSDRMSYTDYATMFHGDDERVDLESLRLSTELWYGLARDLMS